MLPHNCKFCSVTGMFGVYTFRASDVLASSKPSSAQAKGHFFFYDDNFTATPQHTKELLRGMKERGMKLRWTAQARVDVVGGRGADGADAGHRLLLPVPGPGVDQPRPEEDRKEQTVQDIVEA